MSEVEMDYSNTRLNLEETGWKDAVRMGCRLLEDEGLVTEGYSEAIIENIETYGPYVVITEGLAMPHARPEDGVLGQGCSLLTFKEPVDFLGKPVQIIFTLAAPDANSHIDLLKMILDIAAGKIQELIACRDIREVQKIIRA